jgi:hypothetical protein
MSFVGFVVVIGTSLLLNPTLVLQIEAQTRKGILS